jgi:hypothetical protein
MIFFRAEGAIKSICCEIADGPGIEIQAKKVAAPIVRER